MNIIEEIEQLFYPKPYPNIEENIAGVILHYSRAVSGSRYVLLVSTVEANTDLKLVLSKRKKKLKKYYKANILMGIGFIEIFIGDYKKWKDKTNDIKADLHGLRTVILQGVLFIDPKEKKYELLQSNWGPIKFGNFQGQIDKVNKLLEIIEAQ